MENFAQRVRQLRKESGKTQTQMAAVLKSVLANTGAGIIRMCGIDENSDYFGVTTDYLLGRSDQRS